MEETNNIYYFREGLRCVKPYYFTYEVNVKGRWVGKTIKELYTNEFKHIPLEKTV